MKILLSTNNKSTPKKKDKLYQTITKEPKSQFKKKHCPVMKQQNKKITTQMQMNLVLN